MWRLDDLDVSNSVDIEVAPGLGEVGIKVGGESFTGESLVGSEDLGRGGSGGGLAHPEVSAWDAVLSILIAGLLLEGVVLDHGSHEDVVGVGGESWGGDSLVSGSEASVGEVGWVESIELDLNVLLIGVGVGFGVGFHLHVGSVGWLSEDLDSVGGLGNGGDSEESEDSESHLFLKVKFN